MLSITWQRPPVNPGLEPLGVFIIMLVRLRPVEVLLHPIGQGEDGFEAAGLDGMVAQVGKAAVLVTRSSANCGVLLSGEVNVGVYERHARLRA